MIDEVSPPAMVAVFGAGRNGSSLLTRLLDGSPDLWIHPIDVVFLLLWDDLAAGRREIRGASYRTATTRTLAHVDRPLEWSRAYDVFRALVDDMEEVYLPRLRTALALRREALDELERRRGPTTPREFFPALLEAARRAAAREPDPAPRFIGFKTAETAYIDDYARIWPDLKFVHIVREPVANYSSVKRTWVERKRLPFWTGGEDMLRTFIDVRWVPHARAILRRRESDVVVRYEDLVADPAGEVARVCSELGIRPPREPALQTVLGGEHLREFPDNPSKPGVATPEQVVADMAAQFGYDDIVTPREVELIALATQGLAGALGYDEPSVPGRVRLWLRWLRPDADERRNRASLKRLVYELVRRRVYLTRALLFR